MSNDLFLNILNHSNEVIIALDLQGNVIFWNKAAENLFGYTEQEVLGKLFSLVKDNFSYELNTILTKTKEGLSNRFKTQKYNKKGEELEVVFNTHPLYLKDSLIGVSIVAYQLDLLKNVNYLNVNTELESKEHKRTFNVIRDIIVLTIGDEKKTINQISTDSGVNWRTVEKHLTFLIGKKLVSEIFSSEYVRIFELTNNGREHAGIIKKENRDKYLIKESINTQKF